MYLYKSFVRLKRNVYNLIFNIWEKELLIVNKVKNFEKIVQLFNLMMKFVIFDLLLLFVDVEGIYVLIVILIFLVDIFLFCGVGIGMVVIVFFI